jgi:acyl-coenzyme A synthetase/AMP-(fatty) acid ligase
VEVVAALPTTATGKLMRNALKEMAAKLPVRSK